jgi:uncharacterized membrane protein HdeD (DUF308 family)
METLEYELARLWRAVALRGVLAIVFGVLIFFWPGAFWFALAITFAAYALLDGAVAIVAVVTGRVQAGRWALLLQGLAGIAAAAVTMAWLEITELALYFLIAAWAFASGVFQVVAAIQLRGQHRGTWVVALGGALSILLGLALGIFPLAGLVVVAWWVGASFIAFGMVLLALAFQLRGLVRHVPKPRREPEPVTVP